MAMTMMMVRRKRRKKRKRKMRKMKMILKRMKLKDLQQATRKEPMSEKRIERMEILEEVGVVVAVVIFEETVLENAHS